MNKHFNSSKYCLFLFSVYFLLSSCGSDDSTATDTNTATTTVSPASTDASPATAAAVGKAAALTGTLDTLWVSAEEFLGLPSNKKVVFSFTFRDPDLLTLWGWSCKNNNCTNNFDPNPNIKLTNGNPSGTTYGPNVILGNVVIFKKGVERIQDSIGTKYKNVIFAPYKDGEYIRYKIFVTKRDKQALINEFTVEETGVETNPSPPKNNSN